MTYNMNDIKIEATKEVNAEGEFGYIITSIAALPKHQLPSSYIKNLKRTIAYQNNENIW